MKFNIAFISTIVMLINFLAFYTPASAQKLKVPERGFISSEAAETWEHGLITGNGTIGANVMSRPLDELIIFSHERLFLPMGKPFMPPDNANRLFEIRRMIDQGLYKQATRIINLPAMKTVELTIELK